jgi:hypothetical protein
MWDVPMEYGHWDLEWDEADAEVADAVTAEEVALLEANTDTDRRC